MYSSEPTPTVANSDVMADSENEVVELQDVEKEKEKLTDAGGGEEDGDEDSNDSDEEDSTDADRVSVFFGLINSTESQCHHMLTKLFQIFYSEEERNTLKRCFSDMTVAERQGGVQGCSTRFSRALKKVGGISGRTKEGEYVSAIGRIPIQTRLIIRRVTGTFLKTIVTLSNLVLNITDR
jgi:hypothetical protein